MIISNYHNKRIHYLITSSDQLTREGTVEILTYTPVTPPGKPPWTVLVDLSQQFTAIESPDAIVSYWSGGPSDAGGVADLC